MIDKTAFIHPTAIVEEGAVIGVNVHIGPFCIVGANVEIGEGTVLKSHVVINGHTKIGRDNEIPFFTFSAISFSSAFSAATASAKLFTWLCPWVPTFPQLIWTRKAIFIARSAL